MLKLPLKPVTAAGLSLGIFALLAVILLASIQWLTKHRIAENERVRHLLSLHEIVAPDDYDNDLLASMIQQDIQINGLSDEIKIYSARSDGVEITRIYGVTSPDGYSGGISLLVGVDMTNQLRGVRVTSHKETPGLGDKIETNKSDWILQFSAKSLSNPTLKQWRIKKDGGVFDQFTGATITPRAVVNAVRETLKFAAQLNTSKRQQLNE